MSKVPVPVFYSFTDSTRATYAHTIAVHCPNPKHYDNNPSCIFHVEEGNFRCMSCGIKGQALDFVILAEQKIFHREIDELQALRKIARICNQHLSKDEIDEIEQFTGLEYTPHQSRSTKIVHLTPQEALERATRFFNTIPQTNWNAIQFHYMQEERNFNSKDLKKHDVRLNPTSIWSIVLPVHQQFEFQGYISRLAHKAKENETKYKNNPGFLKSQIVGGNLFKGTILLVEGWLDLMRATKYGFPNVACTFGWYCSNEQAAHIRQFADAIIVGYDNDEKGEQGYQRAQTCFDGLPIYRMQFPTDTKDIDTLDEQWFNVELMNSGFQTISREFEEYRAYKIRTYSEAENLRDDFLTQSASNINYIQLSSKLLHTEAKELPIEVEKLSMEVKEQLSVAKERVLV